ncbi:hypothetical protein QAD02_000506 [Eretmocerus hayati]|uniref:Uncharacterized protein n=1 Tax=Eretmocerus hayati TaxID=131215 RepID=A0ACC2NDS3_9HYME|nr:hypothetical protein QAD02_000506 [Eretmocerus hayati]
MSSSQSPSSAIHHFKNCHLNSEDKWALVKTRSGCVGASQQLVARSQPLSPHAAQGKSLIVSELLSMYLTIEKPLKSVISVSCIMIAFGTLMNLCSGDGTPSQTYVSFIAVSRAQQQRNTPDKRQRELLISHVSDYPEITLHFGSETNLPAIIHLADKLNEVGEFQGSPIDWVNYWYDCVAKAHEEYQAAEEVLDKMPLFYRRIIEVTSQAVDSLEKEHLRASTSAEQPSRP